MAVIDGEVRADVEALRAIAGLDVLVPGDEGYDGGRVGFNMAVEHHPPAVVYPHTVAHLIEVVTFARTAGLSVAIQATGHGPGRAAHEAILVDLSKLTGVTLDAERRTARIVGGTKWQQVLDVVAPHGLAPLLGSTPDVSAIGYTLGGGIGWLARKYGTSADSVVAFEIVTAAGEVVRAAADENPELFWALRGAGAGHLGVVTAMEIQLYPIAQVYGGSIFYPGDMAVEVMQRWRDWIPTVPEDLTSSVTLVNFPDDEEVPEELRNQLSVMIRGAFDGPDEEGERLLAHWREWREPVVDMFGPLPFDRIAEISQDPLEPVPYEGTGLWLKGLGAASIEAIVAAMRIGDDEPLMVQAEMRHYGGALARGSSEASAYGNRDALILLELVGVTPTPEHKPKVRAVIADTTVAIAADLTGGHYLNYVEGEDRRFGVEKGIGAEGYVRLAAVKAEFDPENMFDHGLDVTGATRDGDRRTTR